MLSTKEFVFDNFGPLGINLKSCLNGRGAFIDSFQTDGHGKAIDSLAVRKGMQIGDVIASLNDQSISNLELKEIKNRLIQFRHCQLCLTVKRPSLTLGVSPFRDFRHRLFVMQFFQEELGKLIPSDEQRAIMERTASLNNLYYRGITLNLLLPESTKIPPTIMEAFQAYFLEVKSALPELQGLISSYSPSVLLAKCLEALLSELECPKPWNWISEYLHSIHSIKKVAYYHSYPGVYMEMKPTYVSLSRDHNLALFLCWYLFLLTQQRITFADIQFYRQYFLLQDNSTSTNYTTVAESTALSEQLCHLLKEEEDILLRFLESELYQYYHYYFYYDQKQLTKYRASVTAAAIDENFCQHCLQKIVTLPDCISRHFPPLQPCSRLVAAIDPTTEHKKAVLPTDLVMNITQFKTTWTTYNENEELVIRKSFLARENPDNNEDNIITAPHPYFAELRKILGLSLLPQAIELLSLQQKEMKLSQSRQRKADSYIFRDFLLESFASDPSHGHGSSSISTVKEFYYGSQVAIVPCSATMSKTANSTAEAAEKEFAAPMNIHYFEVVERGGEKDNNYRRGILPLKKEEAVPSVGVERITSFSTEDFADSDNEEEEVKDTDLPDKAEAEVEETTNVPKGFSFLSSSLRQTTTKLSQWGARYRSSSTTAIQEDWLTIQEKIVNPLKSLPLPSTSLLTSITSNTTTSASSPSQQVLSCFGVEPLDPSSSSDCNSNDIETNSEENSEDEDDDNQIITPNRLSLKLQRGIQQQQSMQLLFNNQPRSAAFNEEDNDRDRTNQSREVTAITFLSKDPSVLPQLQRLPRQFLQSLLDNRSYEPVEEQRPVSLRFKDLFNHSLQLLSSHSAINLSSITHSDYQSPYEVLVEILSIPLWLSLYFAVLLELKIMIVIPSRSSLTAFQKVTEDDSIIILLWQFLRDCLQPLSWQYPFTSSLLPQEAAIELMGCPVAYFCGITSQTLAAMRKQGVIEYTHSNDDIEIFPTTSTISHNVENLLLIDLQSQQILFPHDFLLSSEATMIQNIYHKAQQLHRSSSLPSSHGALPFPLLSTLQSLLLPQSQKYYESKHPSFGLPSMVSCERSVREFIDQEFHLLGDHGQNNRYNHEEEELVSLPSFPLPLDTQTMTLAVQLQSYFQSVTKEILEGLEDCLVPILTTNTMKTSTSSDLPVSVSQVLFHHDLFYRRKHSQLLRGYQTSSPSRLLFPSVGLFLRSFVLTQSLSELITRLASPSVSAAP